MPKDAWVVGPLLSSSDSPQPSLARSNSLAPPGTLSPPSLATGREGGAAGGRSGGGGKRGGGGGGGGGGRGGGYGAAPAFQSCGSLDYMYSLSSILQHNTRLSSLYLHNHSFSEGGMALMAKALDTNTSLTLLSLRGSSVGDSGAAALAR